MCVCVWGQIYVLVFVFQQVQENPFTVASLGLPHIKGIFNEEGIHAKIKDTSGSELETNGWERQGWVVWRVGLAGGGGRRQDTENHYGDSNLGAQGSETWSGEAGLRGS